MKKAWKILLLCALLAALLCVFAFAADPAESGIYNIQVSDAKATITVDDVTATPNVEIGTYTGDFYANAEKLTVTYTDTGAQYLVFAQNADGVPTKDNLVYIDQQAPSFGVATFTVFPSELKSGTYHVYISGSGMSKTEIGTFDYYAAGVTVSGQVTSYNPNNPTTIQLKKDGAVVASTTIPAATEATTEARTASFNIEKVPAGTYDLVVTKVGHLPYTVKNVVVEDSDIDLTLSGKVYADIVMKAGDVTADFGTINSDDLNFVWKTNNYLHTAGDPGMDENADVNGDGFVNSDDLNLIWKTDHYLKQSADSTFNY